MEQDWKVVTLGSKGGSGQKSSKPKNNEQAMNQAKIEGVSLETKKKFNAGKNSHSSGTPAWKIEENDEREDVSYKRDTVDHDVSLKIQQARLAKKMTQKELATAINEKQTVINDYESGNAVPNSQVLGKLERALGVPLRAPKKKGK